MDENKIKGGIFGVAVGDALGVPVEFSSREELKSDPVVGMRGGGIHKQPSGTWSDDSSLTFCLLESLCDGFDLDDIANNFSRWFKEGYWTPHGEVFGVGGTTREAMLRLEDKTDPTEAGGKGERDNGNGSLMRILPMVFYTKDMDLEKRFELVHKVSSITHAHPRSKMACGFYVTLSMELLKGKKPLCAYDETICIFEDYYQKEPFQKELPHFDRILSKELYGSSKKDIRSGGYVMDTLEASIWAFLNSGDFEETVLTAINLGEDTDTVGAVAGGLSGIWYGFESIPEAWIDGLARKEDIMDLVDRFCSCRAL